MVLVGFEDTPEGRDALALGPVVAGLLDAAAVVCFVTELPGPALEDNELRDGAVRADVRALAAARAAGEGRPLRHVLASSPAQGLELVAEEVGASAVVLGSSDRGPVDRVAHGSTIEQLLYGSSCPVAVAPRGLGGRASVDVRHIAVGYNGTAESLAALEAGAEMALRVGAELTVLSSVEAPRSVRELAGGPRSRCAEIAEQRMSAVLEGGVARLPAELRASARLLYGKAGSELLRASGEFDLMLVGARANAPARRLFLGSTSRRLFRGAGCPVMAFPAPLEGTRAQPAAVSGSTATAR